MELISNSIARCHVVESVHAKASSYDVGSLASVKNIPREYLSDAYDCRSHLLGMVGLIGSSLMIIS